MIELFTSNTPNGKKNNNNVGGDKFKLQTNNS